jgi:hypothetical protein
MRIKWASQCGIMAIMTGITGAQAAPISGSLYMGGEATMNSGMSIEATQVTSWPLVYVVAGNGAFASISAFTLVTMSSTPWTFAPAPGVPLNDLWNVDGFTFDFVSDTVYQSGNFLIIEGTGTISSSNPAYSTTAFTWNLAAEYTGSVVNFIFSASAGSTGGSSAPDVVGFEGLKFLAPVTGSDGGNPIPGGGAQNFTIGSTIAVQEETSLIGSYTSSSLMLDSTNFTEPYISATGSFETTVPQGTEVYANSTPITGLSSALQAESINDFLVIGGPGAAEFGSPGTTPVSRFDFDLQSLEENSIGSFTGFGALVDTTGAYATTPAEIQLSFSSAKNYSFILQTLPEPTPITLSQASFSKGQFKMTVECSANLAYTVQVTTNLASPNWVSLLVVNPPSNSFTFTYPSATNRQQFYRVETAQ